MRQCVLGTFEIRLPMSFSYISHICIIAFTENRFIQGRKCRILELGLLMETLFIHLLNTTQSIICDFRPLFWPSSDHALFRI
jgi:hypothetical protein